ncbi:unnamed protein product [Rotaria magnacalcarata]|uniref:Uncharacterized protein n=1 Tax=Rotaria magnacalcarata TaxID=392030 RepID=A0A814PYG2_9BILA|nr:unnamed protein product [Rotaria magnacalcarata]
MWCCYNIGYFRFLQAIRSTERYLISIDQNSSTTGYVMASNIENKACDENYGITVEEDLGLSKKIGFESPQSLFVRIHFIMMSEIIASITDSAVKDNCSLDLDTKNQMFDQDDKLTSPINHDTDNAKDVSETMLNDIDACNSLAQSIEDFMSSIKPQLANINSSLERSGDKTRQANIKKMIFFLLECLHLTNGVTSGETASKPLHVQLKRLSEFASSAAATLKVLYKTRSSMETVEPATSQNLCKH